MSKDIGSIHYCNGCFVKKDHNMNLPICTNRDYCFKQLRTVDNRGVKKILCTRY